MAKQSSTERYEAEIARQFFTGYSVQGLSQGYRVSASYIENIIRAHRWSLHKDGTVTIMKIRAKRPR